MESESLSFALVGKTGHGKSKTANSLSSSTFFTSSDDFESVTDRIAHQKYEFNGQQFVCIDTPGMFDTKVPFPELCARFAEFTHLCPDGLDAILCVLRKGRMTDEELSALCLLETMFGPEVWKHSVIVFTHCRDDVEELKLRIEQMNDGHKLKKICTHAKHRIAKIDNFAGSDQLESDRAFIHAMIEDVRSDTGRKYTNKCFEFARSKIQEVDDKMSKMRSDHTTQLQQLQSELSRGLLTQAQYESKVVELEARIKDFEDKRQDIELEHLKRSYENWDAFKGLAGKAGIVVFSGAVIAGCIAAVTPQLLALGLLGVTTYLQKQRDH